MELQKRKQQRLKDYDYSENGAYFITICTHNHKNIFWNCNKNFAKNVGDDAHIVPYTLSEYGETAKKYIENIKGLEKYVIMPNHIHMIIIIDGTMKASSPTTKPSVLKIIRSFKTLVTKDCSMPIWQRSYHDHIIRNKNDYQQIWKYIDENPIKWELDRYYEKGDAN